MKDYARQFDKEGNDKYKIRNTVSKENYNLVKNNTRRFLTFSGISLEKLTNINEDFITKHKIKFNKMPDINFCEIIDIDKNLNFTPDYTSAQVISDFESQIKNVQQFIPKYKTYLSKIKIKFNEIFYSWNEDVQKKHSEEGSLLRE